MVKFHPAIPCGYALDLLLAAPAWMPHPVVYMGRVISALEGFLRPRLPQTRSGELLGGAILAAALPAGTLAATSDVYALARKAPPGPSRRGGMFAQLYGTVALGKPAAQKDALTDRRPPEWLLEAADYITEMHCHRHPFERGMEF